eukprot:1031113-Pleurochrysis_carterae.AAC.1
MREWLETLDVAADLVGTNDGVPLAPRAAFPEQNDDGVVTVVTDASAIDGVGGYTFVVGHAK